MVNFINASRPLRRVQLLVLLALVATPVAGGLLANWIHVATSVSPMGKIEFQGDGDAVGGNQTQLRFDSVSSWSPAWSPNGEQIAFRRNRDGNSDIYVMDADGGNVTQLTFNSASK